jgi:hypothetical protein
MKQMAKKTTKFSIYTVFLIMLFFGQMSYAREPMTPLGLMGFALCVPAAVAPWFDKNEKNLALKLLSSLAVFAFSSASAFLGLKQSILVKTVLLVLFFAAYFVVRANSKQKNISGNRAQEIFTSQMFLTLVLTVFFARYFTFTETGFAFLAPAIVIAILIAGAIFVIFINDSDKKRTKGTKIGIFLIVCFVSVFVVWANIANLNYVLDFSEPEAYRVNIEDKDHTRRRKGIDWYTFTVTVNGKPVDIEVSASEYNAYEIGDMYTVNLYKGAFGEPFFIAD